MVMIGKNVSILCLSGGNVTAVFAGHIHHMCSDPSDGIEYIASLPLEVVKKELFQKQVICISIT